MKKFLFFVLFSIVALEPVLAVGGCGAGGCGGGFGGGGGGSMVGEHRHRGPTTLTDVVAMGTMVGCGMLATMLPAKVVVGVFVVTFGGSIVLLAGTATLLATGILK